MSDESEVSLKTVCCTCLSTDRKLQKLCRISEGVNLLYLLLSCDPDAYKEIFCKDSTCLHLCWECEAIVKKIRLFQLQASRAIRVLNSFYNTSGKHTKPLTKLSTHILTNKTIVEQSENFINCGPYINTEDQDDIPLSKLRNNQNKILENITGPKRLKKQTHGTITKLINQENIENNHEKDVSQENDIPESLNSHIKDYKITHSPRNLREDDENETEFLDDTSESPDITTKDYKHTHSPKKDSNNAHKSITNPINSEKDKINQENLQKCYKKKMYNFTGSKKKRKKTAFNEIKLKYPCWECNSFFENKNIRWKHIQKQHREGHQCSVCEKRFALKSNLQRHEKIHSSPPPRQQCETCNKSVRVDLMQAHSLTHTDRQKYACITCDKTFVCRDTYHSHLKYSRAHCESDVLARYKCNTCDKRYRSQAELRDHINYQHKGQTEHKCPVCGKGLATKRCIRRHVRRAHEGIKENARDKICQRCGKTFRDKKSLREHEYIHTGERPLSCELCGQTFRQYASLYSHRKRVHKLVVPQKNIIVLNKD